MLELLTPVGRLVGGHPMESYPVTDNTGAPKLNAMNEPRTSISIGLAIPKNGEQDWKQTPWGQQISNVAIQDWPNGEHRAPNFAWKIIDGDSTIPNKKGNKPCDREGYPGHWVIWAGTEWDSVKCYNAGHYEAHEVIQRKESIKCGDYARLYLSVKGNNPSESPGIYINPIFFELVRAGVEIVTHNGPDASAVLGASAPVLPTNAAVDPNVQAAAPVHTAANGTVITPPPTAVQPDESFVANAANPVTPPPPPQQPVHAMTAAATGSYDDYILAGWTDELLVANGLMQS